MHYLLMCLGPVRVCLVVALLLAHATAWANVTRITVDSDPGLSPVLINQLLDKAAPSLIEAQYNEIGQWKQLLGELQPADLAEQMGMVNRFFNGLRFVNDIDHWNKRDYWATPVELITSGAGDCEDFAIAKYFSLLALGVPEDRMRLMYVNAIELKQAHMVLVVYDSENSAWVLDNITDRIVPLDQRLDLSPVYAFNSYGLWLAERDGGGREIGASRGIKRWDELLSRVGVVSR